MTTADERSGTVTASASTRLAHIVDTTQGPLIGDGRVRRVMPFAITATLGMAIAAPTTTWMRPHLGIGGAILLAAAIGAAMVFPWHRVTRTTQLSVPFLGLLAILLLASASGNGIGSPFVTMSVLPLMWLAIYENRAAVVSAAVLAGVALWLVIPAVNVQPPNHGIVATAVFVICGAGMGITLHGLVRDTRRLAGESRDHQLALEDSASMLDAMPERVNRYRIRDHAITYCNAAWAVQYNVEPAHAIGRPLEQFLSDDELVGLNSQLAILGPDKPILVDTIARSASESGQWLEWVDRYLVGIDGAEVLSIGRDVTERRDAEVRLAESEARFRDLADKSADVVWRFATDPSPHFEYLSPSVENILGYPPSLFLGSWARLLAILDDAGRAVVDRALHDRLVPERFDFEFRHANGSIVIVETRTTPVQGGLQGVSRDVTELRQLQASMAALALRDPLTGLANRRLFDELLDSDLARTERAGLPLAVAFLDLDGLKIVNDNYGHDVGDMVLCETARRLLAIVRGADSVARIGGDEFVIVYAPNDPTSHNLVERIDRALSAPIDITPTTSVSCSPSIGTADTRNVGYNGAALLAAADDAMYEVKRARQTPAPANEERSRVKVVSL
ncbi:MAG: sensor domain-containing diguanylate cyclase [Ilumatobacteraceae bacterium]